MFDKIDVGVCLMSNLVYLVWQCSMSVHLAQIEAETSRASSNDTTTNESDL